MSFYLLHFRPAAKKETLSPTDPRDAFVGKYEAVDSLYAFMGNTDSSGMLVYDFIGAFHYPVVELSKADVFNFDWNRTEAGIHYKVLERDTTNIGKNGERSGEMGYDMDFLVSGSTTRVELRGTNDSKFATIKGEMIHNELVFLNSVWFEFYSITRLRRID